MQVELDTVADGVYGTTGAEAGQKITEGYDVTFTVVAEQGPSGHPVIRYEGAEGTLRRMVAEHYGVDTVTDYFTPNSRADQVRHLIEGTGVQGAALDALVWAIVDAWEADVERVQREWDPTHGE